MSDNLSNKINMKKQTKKKSALESFTNVVLGLIISFCIQLFIYPFLGIPVTYGEMGIITIIFFLASFLRNYLIRRLFNRI